MFKLRLKNYRGFIDEEFTFSKINILIGENSAGKSSIFKFLLALKQSLRVPNNRDSNLTFSGIDTDLGNYQETIYKHEIERNLFFSFEFQKDYFDFFIKDTISMPSSKKGEEERVNKLFQQKRQDVINSLKGEVTTPTTIEFELSEDLSVHNNIKTIIRNKSIGTVQIIHKENTENIAEQDIYLINDKPVCSILFQSLTSEYLLEDVAYEKLGFLTIIVGDSLKEKVETINTNLLASGETPDFLTDEIYWSIGFLLITQNFIQAQLSGIEYINPILSKPAERIYLEGDKKNTRRTGDIKELVDFLSTNNTRPKFRESLSKALSDFGIANDIYIKRVGFTRELRILLNGIDSNIKDVGYGVSLQLPIFAQAIISDGTARLRGGEEITKGETLLIEQPEVHLHPQLQAKFIDALLQIGNNNRYIIETHSEHIIRMLQIIVKEERYGVREEDVSINFLKKEGDTTIKSYHRINQESGKLTPNFPKGFYDVSYNLAFKLME